jgi:L,D-transpeptidase catalytic domain
VRARATDKLAPRAVVTVLEERDGFVRIDDDAWIARKDVRVSSRTTPPAGVAEDEKWFDIDLDEQVLVAYEGARPVYATLVSTGKWGKHATPVVITRIASKLERTTMASDKQDVYSVADVPWTMFYDGNYALHTSYWHDGFGSVRSHGCINLSPHDARLLFRWSSPDVPPGWVAVRGDKDNPGSLVRVRSAKVPEPRIRGYAREMTESIATR